MFGPRERLPGEYRPPPPSRRNPGLRRLRPKSKLSPKQAMSDAGLGTVLAVLGFMLVTGRFGGESVLRGIPMGFALGIALLATGLVKAIPALLWFGRKDLKRLFRRVDGETV